MCTSDLCDVIVKVDLLKNKLGFDDAFNYKEESDLDAALKRLVEMLISKIYTIQMLFTTPVYFLNLFNWT